MKDIDPIITAILKESRCPPQVKGDPVDTVFTRAAQYTDPVCAYVAKEEAQPEGIYAAIEDRLMERIASHEAGMSRKPKDTKAPVPAVPSVDAILAETVVPKGGWDELEERLMQRIESEASLPSSPPHPVTRQKARYVWPIAGLFLTAARSRVNQVVTLCLVAGAAAISLFYVGGKTELATTITQAWGSAYRSDIGVPITKGTTLASSKDGSLTLKNSAGAIHLSGDATVTIEQATSRNVEYRVFTAADRRSGRIAFSVKKRAKHQRFVVVTPWYEIHVVGTRFVLEQERTGSLATTITEGKVRIVCPGVQDLYVDAGQTFSMDAAHTAWRLEAANLAEEIEKALFDESAQQGTTRLVVTSLPPYAQVFINNDYRGNTPFAALKPSGEYAVSIRLNQYSSKDTVITVGESDVSLDVALEPAETDASENADVPAPQRLLSRVRSRTGSSAADTQKTLADILADSLEKDAREQAARIEMVRTVLEKAQKNEAANWKNALSLYKRLAEDNTTPPLYRQTALFSLGRLEADRLKDTSSAIRQFSSYCILYPEGVFTGEALLRLAELEISRNPSAAIEYFQRFLVVDPTHPRRADVAYHLGLLLQQQHNYQEAIRMHTIALEQLGAKASKRRTEIEQMIAAAKAAGSMKSPGSK
ncbi:MAG: tetratricopeptide repeat protein [Chitinispirillaceae bacterium]|nr:tetratricopeptide repeat protein [Chitinispirillaceae bacterium]